MSNGLTNGAVQQFESLTQVQKEIDYTVKNYDLPTSFGFAKKSSCIF